MKDAEYWRQRFTQLEDAQNKMTLKALPKIERQYKKAQAEIEREIARWYERLAKNNGVTLADARKLLTKDELAEFKWTVEEYIQRGEENALDGRWIKELENASAKFHISRYEALKIQMENSLQELFAAQQGAVKTLLQTTYQSGYYHTAFEIQKGFGIGFEIAGVDQARLEKILAKPWGVDNYNFSERIWRNKNKLINEVQQQLTRNLLTGGDPQKAINAISKRLQVSKNSAGRLVMTESAYFSSLSQKDCFNDLGVEEFEIVATLDIHTSDLCRSLDTQHFPLSSFEPGVTAPPFHPWCRTTTAPYFEDDFGEIGERTARDVETGKTYNIPADMTFEEWKKQQDALYGEGTVDKERKKFYNESADRKQYKSYKDMLGKNAPSKFEEFQELKYGDDWNAFKAYARSIKSGELTPLADFKLYKDTSMEIDKSLVGQITSNGIEIKGKSNHFIARVIGSVEQKITGVDIQDIYEALTNPNTDILPIKTYSNGRSQKFRFNGVEVSVNPDSGNLIQVNPLKRSKKND